MLRMDHNPVHRALPARPLLMLVLGFVGLTPTGATMTTKTDEYHRYYRVRRSAALAVLAGLLMVVVVAVSAGPAWARTVSFSFPQNYGIGAAPYSVTSADFDGDGNPDLAVANGDDTNVSVLLGKGDGTFETQQRFAVGDTPHDVTSGDIDGDGNLDLAVATRTGVSVLLNPPVRDRSYSTPEDTTLTVPASKGVLANDSAGGGTLTAMLADDVVDHGTLTFNSNGSFSYTPDADYNGPDYFTFRTNDGTANRPGARVKITVKAANDAPRVDLPSSPNQTVDEDAGGQTVTGFATNISPGPSNESGQQVSFDVANDKGSLFTQEGQPKISPSGTLTYTPAANAHGSATVSVKATDDGGTANGGLDTSAAKTFTITVNPVNDPPTVAVVAGSASQSACLGDTSGRVTLKLADVDNNAGTLTLKATSSNTSLVPNRNMTFGGSAGTRTATIGTLSGRTGSSMVTITVSDGQISNSIPVTVKAGGSGRDTLGGTSGADLLLGQSGDDTLGGAGTDAAIDYNAAEGDSTTSIP